MASWKKFVLYIGSDARDRSVFCPGSKAAMEYGARIGEDVMVQNVDLLLERNHELPEWLDGTPVLVDMEDKQAFKGSECVRFLKDYIERGAEAAEKQQAPTMEEMNGVLPSGERLLHEEEDNFTSTTESKEAFLMNRDNKVTDADLEAYMKMRNSGEP